jgi:diadenylate cyclase
MDFEAVTQQFSNWYFWLGFGLGAVLITLNTIFLARRLRRGFVYTFYAILVPLILLAYLFGLYLPFAVLLAIYVIGSTALIYSDIVSFRAFLANAFGKKDKDGHLVKSKRKFRKIYDHEAVLHEIDKAVDYLSRTRTGALITLERSMVLDDIIKNGIRVDAPVTAQLLTTIFYKGTTLHDGAVVIRDDKIIAASVYYTASTKPLTGKVGSRHRAGLGISEITDSVTVIVSEETGRISIAYKGNLQPVNRDDFYQTLSEYMQLESDDTDNE